MKNIGLFWVYENQIFYELQKLKDIKSINGFKDSNLSHYKVWDKVKKQHPKFYLYNYEDIPRGRVVYNINFNQYIVYCNENIYKDDISKNLILLTFDLLNENVIFKKDEHYQIKC